MEEAWYLILGGIAFMFITGFLGVIYDKSDWIGLAIVIGFIITIRKLNEIIKLHTKKR